MVKRYVTLKINLHTFELFSSCCISLILIFFVVNISYSFLIFTPTKKYKQVITRAQFSIFQDRIYKRNV
jgi:hypothetical protein